MRGVVHSVEHATVAILQCAARKNVIILGEYPFVSLARLSGAPRVKNPTEGPRC